MATIDRMEKYTKIIEELKGSNKIIIDSAKELLERANENMKIIERLEKALLEDYKMMKKLKTPNESMHINPFPKLTISPETSTSMADKVKHSKDLREVYEIINQFYDYKTDNTILRSRIVTKYPRFICNVNADPDIVLRLFTYGFIYSIIVDETLNNISKLPRIIIESIVTMMESFGRSIYGIQVFDASTDLVGKPIIICQMFIVGKNTEIPGDNTSLNMKIPCKSEQFHEWLCEKRARGIVALKSKIKDMIKTKKANIIAQDKGGGETEEIITLHYNTQYSTSDITTLQEMYERIINLKHTHDKKTIEEYNSLTKEKQIIISTKVELNSKKRKY